MTAQIYDMPSPRGQKLSGLAKVILLAAVAAVGYSVWLAVSWPGIFAETEAMFVLAHNVLVGAWTIMALHFLGSGVTKVLLHQPGPSDLGNRNWWKILTAIILVSVPSLLAFHLYLVTKVSPRHLEGWFFKNYLSICLQTVIVGALGIYLYRWLQTKKIVASDNQT